MYTVRLTVNVDANSPTEAVYLAAQAGLACFTASVALKGRTDFKEVSDAVEWAREQRKKLLEAWFYGKTEDWCGPRDLGCDADAVSWIEKQYPLTNLPTGTDDV